MNSPHDNDVPISLGMEIRRTEHLIKRRICQLQSQFDSELSPELTGGQGVVLGYILHCGLAEVYQKDIEQKFNVRRSTATVVLKKMEKSGIICRVPAKTDARLKKIVVTPAGHKAAEKIESCIVAMENEMIQGITLEEQTAFINILKRINRNLESDRCGEIAIGKEEKT